jgi:ribosomal protein L11 methyltransferase
LKTYPAAVVQGGDPDLIAALVDDFSPIAIEPREDDVRVFFGSARDRDEACRSLAAQFEVVPLDVSDEDWARRSQEGLEPVTVGRLTIFPNAEARIAGSDAIVIVPSMGFGTGHHATTRLCLAALQTLDLAGRDVLDVGTGSGVLAIAADRLGAARALGIDYDADAIQSARENLELNPDARHVSFAVADMNAAALPAADVVTANLTGALLVRSAARLLDAVRPGGTLILSGILAHERDAVVAACLSVPDGVRHHLAQPEWERAEDGWIGVAVKKS